MAEHDKVAVTVRVRDVQLDYQLPLGKTVYETIQDLIPEMKQVLASHDRDTSFLDEKGAKWALVKGTNSMLVATETLEQAGVKRGDTLQLEKTAAKETYAALLDDVPESLARYQIERFSSWSPAASAGVLMVALPLMASTIAFATASFAKHVDKDLVLQIASAALLGVFAALGLTIAVKACKPQMRAEAHGGGLSAIGNVATGCGIVFAAGAAVAAVPGAFSLWSVLASGLTVFLVSAVVRLTTKGAEFSAYLGLMAGGITSASAVLSLVLQVSGLGAAAIMVVVAATVLMFAAQIALNAANIPKPYVPTLGEDFVNPNDELRIDQLPTAATTEAIESIINRERQTLDAHNAVLGLTSGGILALVLGAMGVLLLVDQAHATLVLSLLACVTLATLFQAKSHDDLATQAVWLAGTVALCVLTPLLLGMTHDLGSMVLLVSVALCAVMLVTVIFVLRGREITSPVVLRGFEVIEFFVILAMYPILAVLIDVFGMVRG